MKALRPSYRLQEAVEDWDRPGHARQLEQQLHKKCTKAFSLSLSPNSPGPASSERRKVMCFASHNCNAATTTERERGMRERERERERDYYILLVVVLHPSELLSFPRNGDD